MSSAPYRRPQAGCDQLSGKAHLQSPAKTPAGSIACRSFQDLEQDRPFRWLKAFCSSTCESRIERCSSAEPYRLSPVGQSKISGPLPGPASCLAMDPTVRPKDLPLLRFGVERAIPLYLTRPASSSPRAAKEKTAR